MSSNAQGSLASLNGEYERLTQVCSPPDQRRLQELIEWGGVDQGVSVMANRYPPARPDLWQLFLSKGGGKP